MPIYGKISTCFSLSYIKSSLTKTSSYTNYVFVHTILQKIHGFFFTAKDAWSFYKLCDFKRSIAQWLFPLCFIQIDNILKRHFLTPRVLFCTQPFYPSNAQKTHFIVKRKLAYHVHLLFLMSSHKFVWEFNENFNRKKQERFVWVLIRVFRDIHYVADRKKVNRLWLPLE